jgi:cyanophycinase
LALLGGDELKPGNEPHDEVLATSAGNGPAFVLATAAARQRPDLAVRNAQRWFARFGLAVEELPVLRRSQATSAEVAARAIGGRFFYLVGGDPGHVAATLRDTPVWSSIVQAWRAGAALAGSSAGAMALGRWTLIRARMPGDTVRRYRDALGLVPEVAVIPHFTTFGRTWVDSAARSRPTEGTILVGVDERAAAVWWEGGWRAMGAGGVTVITSSGEHRFEPGGTIEGLPAPGENA